jgi:hypothetical protein
MAKLCIVEPPSGAEVYALLDHAIANCFEVAKQTERKAFDSFRNCATYFVVP